MKSIVYIATLAILFSCGKNDNAPDFIYERSTEVDNLIQLSGLELDLRSLAILENSDADNSIGLESEYFRQHYRFYTDEGKRQLVDLLIREKSQEEIKVLFGLLLSQFTVDSSKLSTLEENLHLIQRAEEQNKAIQVLPLDKTLFLVQLVLDKDAQRDHFTIEENHEVITSLGELIFNWAGNVDLIFNLYSKAIEIHYKDLYKHDEFYTNKQFSLKYLIGSNLKYLEDKDERTQEELAEKWLERLEELTLHIEKKTFVMILQEQLINPSRNFINTPVRIPKMHWDMKYSSSLGGCSGVSQRSSGVNLDNGGGPGRYCSYGRSSSTNSEFRLQNSLKSQQIGSDLNITAIIASSIRGGYQARRGTSSSKNHVVNLNYTAKGEIEIPVCRDILKCNPIVEIKNLNPRNSGIGHYSGYSKRPANGSSQRVRVNGKNLKVGRSVFVDRSRAPIKIRIDLSRNDSHSGACCFDSNQGQQRVHVKVIGIDEFPTINHNGNSFSGFGSNGFGGFGGNSSGGFVIPSSPIRYNQLGVSKRNLAQELLLDFVESDKKKVNEQFGIRSGGFFRSQQAGRTGFSWKNDFDYHLSKQNLSYFSVLYGTLDLIRYIKSERSHELNWKELLELNLLEEAISNYSRSKILPIVHERMNRVSEMVKLDLVRPLEKVREEIAIALELRQFELLTMTSQRLIEIIRIGHTYDVSEDAREKIEELFRLIETQEIEALSKYIGSLDQVINEIRRKQESLKLDIELSTLEMAQYE